MKNFSYIHVEKLHDMGRGLKETHHYHPKKYSRYSAKSYTRYWGVEGCWQHDMRLIETANADPKRFAKNTIVCAETDWKPEQLTKETIAKIACDKADFISKKAAKYIAENHTGDKIRDDAVRVCMLLSAVSPQYLRDMSTSEWDEYLSNKKHGLKAEMRPLNETTVTLWKKATVEYNREKYGDRIMCMMFHDDESNPHCTVYLVPMVEKEVYNRGPKYKDPSKKRKTRVVKTLCAKEMFTPDDTIWEPGKKQKDGTKMRGKWILLARGTCSLMQDEYANFLKESGLKVRRGNRRNQNQPVLDHETNRELYERACTAIAEVRQLPDSELRPFLEAQAVNMADARSLRIQRDHHQIIAADNQEKTIELEAKLVEIQAKIIENQRELPVEKVISKLMGINPIDPDNGGESTSKGDLRKKNRSDILFEFLLPNGLRLGVTNGNAFENLTPDIPFEGNNAKRLRGKGALDAIMFLTGWEFKEANEWIVDSYSAEEAGKVLVQKYTSEEEINRDEDERFNRKIHSSKIFHDLITPDASQWASTCEMLQRTFKVRKDVIDHQHDLDFIDANKYGHLVFKKVRWDDQGELVSAGKIIVDLKNPTFILKETGDSGLYFDADRRHTKVVFCSSPMESLAMRSMPEHNASTLVVVGNSPSDETVIGINHICKNLKGGMFWADSLTTAGQRLKSWLSEKFPSIQTLPLPNGFLNWLDYHRHARIKSVSNEFNQVDKT